MTLTQLRYAIAVRDHHSMSAAADACHVSQPSLSQAIQNLEEDLGIVLFERGPKGARPTSEGREILAKADRVMQALQEVEEVAAASSSRLLEGRLKIGVIQTLGPYLLPQMLPAMGRRYPALEMEVDEGLTDQLLDDLRNYELDAVLLALPWEMPDEIRVREVFDEPFYVALSPDDHLADQETIALDEVDPDDLLLLKDGHCLRDHTLDACDVPPGGTRRAFQGASLETVRAFVSNGWGLSLFPALAVKEQPGVAIRPPREPASRTIALAIRRSSPYADEIDELADTIAEIVEDVIDVG